VDAAIIPLIYVLAFVAVVLLVQSAAGLFFAGADRTQRVNRRLTMLGSGMSRDQVYAALIRQPLGSNVRDWRLARFIASFAIYCRQAGISTPPERLLLITGVIAAVIWLAATVASGASSALQLILNGAVCLVGAVVLSVAGAWSWLRRLRARRLKRIEEQLPGALDIVTRALRAGHPVISAVHLAAEELGDPLGSEFGLLVDETTYGIELEEALLNFANRTGSGDAHFFAVSVNIQAETGGNLAEILNGLAIVIRGRATLGKRVKSLASEGRASAVVISVLPILVVGVQLLVHPQIYTDKFSDPIFWPAVAITGAVYAVGWLIINRIVNFKY
jgi:tight adherence protein B